MNAESRVLIEPEVPVTHALKLTARRSAELLAFLSTSKPAELVEALGSPLNILFPEATAHNLGAFQAAFAKHRVRGQIYFAHKSNRSHSLPRYLSTTIARIDVSSPNELKNALGSGFRPERIQATGPKNREFLHLCLQLGVLISVDSLAELLQIIELQRQISSGEPNKVLLRVSGFKNRQGKHQGKSSRFGINYIDVEKALTMLAKIGSGLQLIGFAFHLDTVSPLEKAIAAEGCLALFERAMDLGFDPAVINIGGGFKVSYLESAEEWHQYGLGLREAALGARPQMTWQGNSFGLIPDKGNIRGSFNSYSFYDSSAGSSFLDEILGQKIESFGDGTLGKFLSENGIELWIEPGRALLDQVGITIAKVITVREASQGEKLVCLNMKRQDHCFVDQENFVDPIVLYRNSAGVQFAHEHPVYFAGNLCLESDLITRHQTYLPRLPEVGDLVVFVNTAGYFMDFSASEAIMQPLAKKVAVRRTESCFTWTLDENYHPTAE